MDNIREYKYIGQYITKDGTIKNYTAVHKRILKDKKIKQKELIELVRDIKDQRKYERIKEFLLNIKNEKVNLDAESVADDICKENDINM